MEFDLEQADWGTQVALAKLWGSWVCCHLLQRRPRFFPGIQDFLVNWEMLGIQEFLGSWELLMTQAVLGNWEILGIRESLGNWQIQDFLVNWVLQRFLFSEARVWLLLQVSKDLHSKWTPGSRQLQVNWHSVVLVKKWVWRSMWVILAAIRNLPECQEWRKVSSLVTGAGLVHHPEPKWASNLAFDSDCFRERMPASSLHWSKLDPARAASEAVFLVLQLL